MALQTLREHLIGVEVGVIVTDRELALMNALQHVFPNSVSLLCTFHVEKNVGAHCKKYVTPTRKCETILDAWKDLMYRSDESLYEQQERAFEKLASEFPKFYKYVHETWLDLYKENFLVVYTKRHMHLGNTTSNR